MKTIQATSEIIPDGQRMMLEEKNPMPGDSMTCWIMCGSGVPICGINFPVSAVIMGAYHYPYTGAMPVRDFWNLAGRVGRAGQDNMGWVGLAVQNDSDLHNVGSYVRKASDELHSQLVSAIDNAFAHREEGFAKWLYFDERWSAIFQYISHLRRQTEHQDAFLSQLELKLQATFGYNQLTGDNRKPATTR